MNEVSLKPVIEELENLFSKFNARFFADKLEKPVITVSPDHTRGAYGWCTGWKAWKAGEDEGHYCLYRRNELGKAFILIGDKSNGKSTFLHVVKNMLGDKNIASLDLKELGDRFKTAELFGKLANIGDDIST